jgi:superfamily I DNA and/or RNA helicase
MLEDAETEQGSRRNNHEADIVFKHAKALIEAGIEASQIGIITPYNGQLEALKGLFQAVEGAIVDDVILADKLRQIEIKTIDGFQVYLILYEDFKEYCLLYYAIHFISGR